METLFDTVALKKKIEELETIIAKPGFWEDSNKSATILQELKQAKGKYTKYEHIQSEIENLKDITTLLESETDEELEKELD